MSRSPLENERSPSGASPHALANIGVVLVAAGRGERLGSKVPKAFVELRGRALVEFGIAEITALPHSGHLVVVAPPDHAARTLELVARVLPEHSTWEVSVVPGGRERHESVRFGLEALPESVDTVLVHDAARPFANAELFERVLAEVLRTGDAVVPALAVSDTLKRVDSDGVVHETVDRDAVVAVQTPQGFPRELLAAAHSTALLQDGDDEAPTDDAEVVQRSGGVVRVVRGDARAHKLTTSRDMLILETILGSRAEQAMEAS